MAFPFASVPERLICLDIETVPDRARLPPAQEGKFPKPVFHRIACISYVEATIAVDGDGGERYDVSACRSGGEADWDERRLIEGFWAYVARRPTRVVTWNGRGFDIPVLLQRSMVHGLAAPAWFAGRSRAAGYTYRYSDAWHCDLMDVMADHGACPKLSLDDIAGAIGLPGKIGGHGSDVDGMVAAGEIAQVRAYCEGDVLNLFGIYARHGLLTGRVTKAGHDAAMESLLDFLLVHGPGRPHLAAFVEGWGSRPPLTTAERDGVSVCESRTRQMRKLTAAEGTEAV